MRSVAPEAAARKEPKKERTQRVDWAQLPRRTFGFDVFTCERCDTRVGRRILAKNVVLNAQASQKTGVSAAQTAQDSNVDPDLRVLASNVQLDNANNALESSNLQAALDDELAVGLATLLPGTTWSITNRAGDPEAAPRSRHLVPSHFQQQTSQPKYFPSAPRRRGRARLAQHVPAGQRPQAAVLRTRRPSSSPFVTVS